MRIFISLLIGAAMLAPGAAQARERLSGEAQIAKALDGRVAGEPVDCIAITRGNQSSQVIPGEAIIYKNGSTLYLNRPRAGAESLSDRDIMVTRPFGSRLCSTDTVVLHDRYSHFVTGTVFLGEFVPYRKVETSAR